MARFGRETALSRDFPSVRKQPRKYASVGGLVSEFATFDLLCTDLLEPHVVVGLIPGGSSDVALCADLASLAHNHFDRCDLLRRRVIHNGARTGLATMAAEAPKSRLQKEIHRLATLWTKLAIDIAGLNDPPPP